MQGFFKNGNFSHVTQLEHFSLQSSKTICLEASTRNCVRKMKTLAWILFQNSRRGLPYTELVVLLLGDLCVLFFLSFFFLLSFFFFSFFFLTTNLAFEDVVFIWGFVHHCQDCNIKNHTGH